MVPPAKSPLNEPVAVTEPVAPPMTASSFSVKPPTLPVLLMLSAWLSAVPTWRSPKFTGFGAAADAGPAGRPMITAATTTTRTGPTRATTAPTPDSACRPTITVATSIANALARRPAADQSSSVSMFSPG